MKTVSLLTLVSLFLISQTHAQTDYALEWSNKVETMSGKDEIDGEKLYCYSTIVYEASKGKMKSIIADEVKLRTGEKGSQKKMKEGVAMNFPNYTSEQILVKSKVEDVKKSDNLKVVVAFYLDSANINPDMPKAHEAANEVVQNIGVILNKSIVAAQIAEAQEHLEDLEKDREKLVKEKEKLNKTVTDGNQKIKKLDADKSKMESKLINAQDEATLLEAATQASTATSKDIKKYASAKDKVVKIEADMLKNQENVKKENEKVNEANSDLPENAKAIEENAASIESAKEVVTKLNAKYDAVK